MWEGVPRIFTSGPLDSKTRVSGLWLLRLFRPRMRLFCPFLMACKVAILDCGGLYRRFPSDLSTHRPSRWQQGAMHRLGQACHALYEKALDSMPTVTDANWSSLRLCPRHRRVLLTFHHD